MGAWRRERSQRRKRDDSSKALPGWLRCCAIALAWVAAAFVIRFLLKPLLGDELPLMLFVAAALGAAAFGGAMAGVLALVLGLFLGDYFLVSSEGVSAFTTANHWIRITRYIFTVVIGIILIENLHRNQKRAKEAVDDLQRSEAQLKEAQIELSRHAENLELLVRERTSELEESLQSLEGMLYHIAHNLRAPLRSLDGFATLLHEDYGSKLDKAGLEYTARIQKASQWMDTLIGDLLALGRLSHIKIVPERTELKSAVARVVSRMTIQIRSKEAVVETSGPSLEVWASPSLLDESIFNLLDNALKFVFPGMPPNISISIEEHGPKARLLIRDKGPGVDPKYHKRIFQAFERLEVIRNEGTGIGLALVKIAMHRMAGEVGVESEPGKGSCFWLELPRCLPLQPQNSIWLVRNTSSKPPKRR